MNPQSKKMAVLYQLSQEATPQSLGDLLSKLGTGFAERSVRRWLSELISEGLIEKVGKKRSTKYQVVERDHRQGEGISSCFGAKSAKVISKISQPIYERQPVLYADEWLDSYQPNETFYIPLDLRTKLFNAGTRSRNKDPAGTYAHKIFNRLLIDLSYNSSRLEGNTYSLLDTERLLLEGKSAEGKLDEEKVMILNHKEAIRYLVDNAFRLEISEETVLTIHFLLSDELLERASSGKFRNHPVRISGSTYIPFEDPKDLEKRFSQIIKKAKAIKDPYEQSLFLLIHITYLQGFTDVNKRTARLSANIPLIKNNLVPLSFNDVDRSDYLSAMIAVYELQNIQPILDLYIFSYMRTCMMYDSTVQSLGFDEIRVLYRQERRRIIREIILRKLSGSSIEDFVSAEALQIDDKDRKAFLEDLYEDIEELDRIRIAGLGVTPEQFEEWVTLQ